MDTMATMVQRSPRHNRAPRRRVRPDARGRAVASPQRLSARDDGFGKTISSENPSSFNVREPPDAFGGTTRQHRAMQRRDGERPFWRNGETNQCEKIERIQCAACSPRGNEVPLSDGLPHGACDRGIREASRGRGARGGNATAAGDFYKTQNLQNELI